MRAEKVPEDVSWSLFFAFEKTFFRVSIQNFCHCLAYMEYKISHCLSANQNPELRYVICTGVTLELHCSQPIRIENFFTCIISIVVYPNWPLFHGSLIKNWGKLDPLFCVWTMMRITSRGIGIIIPKRKTPPQSNNPYSHISINLSQNLIPNLTLMRKLKRHSKLLEEVEDVGEFDPQWKTRVHLLIKKTTPKRHTAVPSQQCIHDLGLMPSQRPPGELWSRLPFHRQNNEAAAIGLKLGTVS